jgi:putative salt-induced outer membrane protein
LLLVAAHSAPVQADDTPAPPPPQHEWIGKGQAGFLDSKGNSTGESINGALDLSRYDGDWKNALHVEGFYGKSGDVVSAERWIVNEQTDYTITSKTFAFGGLRFEHDQFDGFVYQASITAGMGYKILDTASDKFTVQAGAGFKRFQAETIDKNPDGSGEVVSRIPLDTQSEAIATAGVDYAHSFNKATTLSNKLLLEYGTQNTLTTDQLALAVKMSTKLALSVGYQITDNSKPPMPLKKVDTVTTVNLVYAF